MQEEDIRNDSWLYGFRWASTNTVQYAGTHEGIVGCRFCAPY